MNHLTKRGKKVRECKNDFLQALQKIQEDIVHDREPDLSTLLGKVRAIREANKEPDDLECSHCGHSYQATPGTMKGLLISGVLEDNIYYELEEKKLIPICNHCWEKFHAAKELSRKEQSNETK